MILQSGYSHFWKHSRLFLKSDGWKPFLFFDQFYLKVSTNTKNFLETVQKVGKKVGIHFFENIHIEKIFACKNRQKL